MKKRELSCVLARSFLLLVAYSLLSQVGAYLIKGGLKQKTTLGVSVVIVLVLDRR